MTLKFRFLFAIAVLFYFYAFLGVRSLWEPDEGRYTAVAMEMIRLNDWVLPHLSHEQPHWTKPPLTYWLIAGSISAFGRHEFAARIPSATSFLFTTYLAYLMGQVFLQRRAWLAPLVYASFLCPFLASNIVSPDSLLTLWETAAVCAFVCAVWGSNREQTSLRIRLMWCAFALAFFTKGPPGLLPLIPIVVFLRMVPAKENAVRLQWLTGLGIFLAINLPWFGYVIATHTDLLRYYLMDEVVGRVFTDMHHRNSGWFGALSAYGPMLLLGTLPWTHRVVYSVYKNVRTLIRDKQKPMDRQRAQDFFLLLWIFLPLVVFALASSRLPFYILPLFIPMSMLVARQLESVEYTFVPVRVVALAVWFLLIPTIRIATAYIPTHRDAFSVSQEIVEQTETIPAYSEIVFYDTKPVLGLNFYLDMEIETVERDGLKEELGEDEARLWVMHPQKMKQFFDDTAGSHRTFKKIGNIENRFVIIQEIYANPENISKMGYS